MRMPPARYGRTQHRAECPLRRKLPEPQKAVDRRIHPPQAGQSSPQVSAGQQHSLRYGDAAVLRPNASPDRPLGDIRAVVEEWRSRPQLAQIAVPERLLRHDAQILRPVHLAELLGTEAIPAR